MSFRGGGFGEIEVVEKIVGFFGARSDFHEPHADATGLVCAPDVLFGPAETGYSGASAADRVGDLAFLAVKPVAIRGKGREGGGAPQLAIDIKGVVTAEGAGEGPAGISQRPEESGEELTRGHVEGYHLMTR